ncbi:MAG: hypothetical protein MUE84_01965, partial [Hyphomonas sp.]|nr:hypothetical protein [Hyphomonas sp.]
DALWRIGFATLAMTGAVKLIDADATPLSLAAAICVGAAVYGAALAAVYPDILRKLTGLLKARRAGAGA